jgi:hypothetical protein
MVLSLVQVNAQIENVRFKLGPEKKRTMMFNFSYIDPIGHTNELLYGKMAPIMGMTRYRLFGINPDLDNFISEYIEPEQEKMSTDFENLLMLKKQLHLFVSFQNQKLKKTFLLSKPVNNLSLLPEGNLKPVVEIDYSTTNKYKNTVFEYVYSQDSSKLLIMSGLINNDQSLVSWGMTILDENLNKVWNIENQLPRANDKVYSFVQFAVSNSGDAYVLCKVFDNKKEFKVSDRYRSNLWSAKREEKPNYAYAIFTFLNTGSTLKEIQLEVPGMFVRSLKLGVSNKGKVVCAGLYGNLQNLSAIGTCSFVLNTAGTEVSMHKSAFNLEVITKGIDKRDVNDIKEYFDKGEDFEDYLYTMQPIVFRNDGGFWMAAEQKRSIAKTSQGVTYIVNNYDGVYLANFAPDGDAIWTNKLVKYQKTTGYDNLFSSVFMHGIDDNLIVTYNSFETNMMQSIKWKEASTMMASYNSTGDEKIKTLFTYRDADMLLCPQNYGYMSENSVWFYAMVGTRKYRFIQVDYK